MQLSAHYWQQRYEQQNTGWDIGYVSPPLQAYFDQLTDKYLKILVPGAGNAYEAEYLYSKGFLNTYILDWAKAPLEKFKKKNPSFPDEQLLEQDFFELTQTFDLIIEQTFFCAIDPSQRKNYVQKMHELLHTGGKLVGVLFNIPLNTDKPPFGGEKSEYLTYFEPYFQIKHLEVCYNSIPPRLGNELFMVLVK